jgi:hypothetical protein
MAMRRTLLLVGLLALAVTVAATRAAEAHDSEFPFLGEIALLASPACPADWLPTDGRLLRIDKNIPLYSLLGTVYGGDGVTTFALPKLECGNVNLTCCIATAGSFPRQP